jgi:hypothetical protein
LLPSIAVNSSPGDRYYDQTVKQENKSNKKCHERSVAGLKNMKNIDQSQNNVYYQVDTNWDKK